MRLCTRPGCARPVRGGSHSTVCAACNRDQLMAAHNGTKRARPEKPYVASTPKRAVLSDGKPSWWLPQERESLDEHQRRFYAEVRAREAAMQASTFGRILGRPTLGPNQVTTMQVNRWRREE